MQQCRSKVTSFATAYHFHGSVADDNHVD